MQVNTKISNLISHKTISWLLTCSILLIGSFITYQLWSNALRDNQHKLNVALEDSADVTINNLSARLNAILVIMRGVKGFVDGSESVSSEEFHTYIHSLNLGDKFGVRGIALVELINDENKEQHILQIQKRGLSDYQIKPAGKRNVYAPITLIEPFDALNVQALGLDVLTLPSTIKALEEARDTNQARISTRMTLAQDVGSENQHSFVMYLPVYKKNMILNSLEARRNAIIGWVDVPFRIADLMNGFKGEIDDDVEIKIYQNADTSEESFLYRTAHHETSEQSIVTKRTLEIGGAQWTLLFSPTPAFEARIVRDDKPMLIGLLGITLTILTAFLAWFLLSSRQRAENRYQKLFNQAGDGVLVLDFQHRFISANLAAIKMLGYEQNALINMQLPDLLTKNIVNAPEFMAQLTSDYSIKDEWEYIRKDGTRFIGEVNCRKLDNQYYFAIVRDLTDRKLAEYRINHLTQLYQALSEVNQAIVRMGDDNDLFSVVCRCSVNFGGMKMAWVGQVDEESQR
ncbi:MAG: diguanylate cyclase, partial [Methylotenera sp.]|uniref:CHASE domain-containing protein n=1 Tax=Methylotenera sp. TaxID=2051956 RepID=UPI000D43CDF1